MNIFKKYAKNASVNMDFSRKDIILHQADEYAVDYLKWMRRKTYFCNEDIKYLKFLIPKNLKILDIGCGLGDKLAALEPSYGVGIDLSPRMIESAKNNYPNLNFIMADIESSSILTSINDTFDVILLSDSIGLLEDCQSVLTRLHKLCNKDTRIVISYYSRAWDPILKIAEILRQRMPQIANNYLATTDICNFLNLAGFQTIKREWRQLLPVHIYGISTIFNKYIATLPGIRRLCLRNYVVARPIISPQPPHLPSVSVVVPCRNERGNIEAAIQRLPNFCSDLEILFIEGHSHDGTLDEIYRVMQAYPDKNIKVFVQQGKGKGDAVRLGFQHASGDILMILDADLTTPPEDLPKFYEALVSGKGEFINGSRLIYPMKDQAMQFLNYLANNMFSWLFSYLLNQRLTDTLCGTKVLYKKNYIEITENRGYFGTFDPFGDFDLIFGASKLNLQILEIPIRYDARTYGSTQISRFSHGWLLLNMVLFAYKKLKAF